MAILALGISYRSAGVDLLERLAFADDDFTKAYRRASDDDALRETVVLSTCNRVEVYASVETYHAGFLSLKRLLCETRGVDPDRIGEALYSHYEEAAVEHLFRVAAGLDSMVLGEPQILSQVRSAERRAVAEGAAGPAITAVFHAATRAGRRVRTETTVGAAPDAFVDAGASLAASALGGLTGRRALVVGAGHMAALAAKHLRARGIGHLRVLNRSVERARSLAERTGGEPGPLSDLPAALADVDLVVSSTGATGIVIDTDTVSTVAAARRDRPMFIVDLAVPRDVEASVTGFPGVTLVDLGALRQRLEEREAAIADVERAAEIVDEEVRRFLVHRRSEHLAPLITELRRRGDEVLVRELERHRSPLSDLTADERQAVESLARSIVSKLLHDPIVRLKERSGPGSERTHARLLAELFDVELPDE